MAEMKITILADNQSIDGWRNEHGLSLLIEAGRERILFDTGAGTALMPNLETGKVNLSGVSKLILSHGHHDHTGGLSQVLPLLQDCEVLSGPDIAGKHFSLHADGVMKEISMPPDCAEALKKHPFKREFDRFTAIAPGIFLTGPIPRISGEDCGGDFYLDPQGKTPDFIAEETALLLESGVLIQGCCHAGIINTLEHCRKQRPDIRIHTVIGGLHLLHAGEERLKQTADCLKSLSLKRLILLHCTGPEAEEYRQTQGICETVVGKAGEVYHG